MLRVDLQKRFEPGPRSAGFDLDVQFEAEQGVTALFGPSGAGKTLTLDSIAGFTRPDAGSIHLGEETFFEASVGTSLPARDRRCGYLFQSDALFPHLTVAENLSFSEAPPERVAELLARFHIADLAGRRPHEISGGERQRCALARTLAADPRLLLMDEPGQGLDRPLREELLDLIREWKERLPIMLVTHDLADAFAVADRMLVLSAGRIVQRGAPEEIYRNPATPQAARLLGMDAELAGRVVEASAGTISVETDFGDRLSLRANGPGQGDRVRFCLRSDAVRAAVRNGSLGPSQTLARLERWTPVTGGVRLTFAGGLGAEVSRETFLAAGDAREWVLEFPEGSAAVFPDSE